MQPNDTTLDYYTVLGVKPDATADMIRKAHRERVALLHPDRFDKQKQQKQWQTAHRMLTELNKAYEVLSDPKARREYDQRRNRQEDEQPETSAKEPRSSPQNSQAPKQESSVRGDKDADERQHRAPAGTREKRIVAAVLAIWLGAFGAQDFYLGRPILGLVFLTLSVTSGGFLAPIPMIVGVVEGIIYLTMSDAKFHEVQQRVWFWF